MSTLITAVALDRAGDHPAAWRESAVDPRSLLDPQRLRLEVQTVEAAGVDFVTVPDSLAVDASGSSVPLLDAVTQLAAVAPVTDRIGLVPTVTTTHTEPFHLQAAVASVDFASLGRAGWQPTVSLGAGEAAAIGRRGTAAPEALWQEAGEVIDVARLLWDSWEDDAEIRDVATGRFIDRDKLHYVDHVGSTFSVKGPSIVPRSPQGHPVTVVSLSDTVLTDPVVLRVAARADVVLVPAGADFAARRVALAAAVAELGRDFDQVRVLIDASVVFDLPEETAATRIDRLQGRTRSGPPDLVGSLEAITERIAGWAGGVDGIHLRPWVIAADLPQITAQLIPALRAGGLLPPAPTGPTTFRDRLGLTRPVNVFAAGREGALSL
ncbi:LLM class flavin-dependent oxidoreductase [Nakamurella sp. A5-74]|uniref:LLM class flavin-dependent oxidoreductase n=1 Tax=Nakamurella sp. A5-74 TaxID=3158264 RepID=A0AAU8DU38_9ACTN